LRRSWKEPVTTGDSSYRRPLVSVHRTRVLSPPDRVASRSSPRPTRQRRWVDFGQSAPDCDQPPQTRPAAPCLSWSRSFDLVGTPSQPVDQRSGSGWSAAQLVRIPEVASSAPGAIRDRRQGSAVHFVAITTVARRLQRPLASKDGFGDHVVRALSPAWPPPASGTMRVRTAPDAAKMTVDGLHVCALRSCSCRVRHGPFDGGPQSC
jgi:hypothetical protein